MYYDFGVPLEPAYRYGYEPQRSDSFEQLSPGLQTTDVSVTIASLPLRKHPSVIRRQALKSDHHIPPDFDKPWSKSDVVLRIADSDGKELHANKAVLSVFSPYFDALFSGRFDNDVHFADMNCDYNAMKEILRNIHHVDCCNNAETKFDNNLLRDMYYIGDFYNFPHIREMCLKQMTEQPSVEMAVIAAGLGLQHTLMDILKRLHPSQVKLFLEHKDVNYLFTKNEVICLYERINEVPLRKADIEDTPPEPLNLEEIAVELQDPRIDLTKSWKLADVAITTKNSMGRILYANQSVMEVVSNKFENLSFTPLLLQDEARSISSVTVDAEYATMKEILSVVHHCDINYEDPPRLLHSALLHSMYSVAAVDQLDIPMIRKFCVANLLKQPSVDSLEVFADLDISLTDYELPISKWLEWINRKEGHFSYRKGDEVVVLTPSQDEPRFAADLVLWLINQFSSNMRRY